MRNEEWQTILNAGCEGGCIVLVGKKSKGCWTYKLITDETTLSYIFDEKDLCSELKSETEVVYSWEGALQLLEKYPHWPGLYPVTVHKDYATRVIEALQNKEYSKDKDDFWQVDWPTWARVCIEAKANSEILTLNSNGFCPEFTDTSKKPIVAKRSVYAEEKKIQPRI